MNLTTLSLILLFHFGFFIVFSLLKLFYKIIKYKKGLEDSKELINKQNILKTIATFSVES